MATVSPTQTRGGHATGAILLVLALAIGVAAYVLVGIGVDGAAPADVLEYGVGMGVLALSAYVVVRWRAPHADPVILPTVVALNGVGLAMIYRIDLAYASRGKAHGFADRQLVWTAISVALALVLLIVL
jgi:hypothetical protein